jgi:crotonobetainyl-CoA:carnitine CoA-transferase CaiB-like acyl-CoA transferase
VQPRYGQAATALPRRDRPSAISGYFRTVDDRYFCVVPRGPACFPALMRAIGRPYLAEDPRHVPPIADLEVVRALRAEVDRAFAGMTLDEAGALLTRADLIWAPMASLDEVTADSQAHDAGCFVKTPDAWGGSFPAPASPIRFADMPADAGGPAPRLGQHTREVLLEAGLAPDVVERLLRDGAATQAAAVD